MGMNHLGYILYLSMVVALIGSPLLLYFIYRGWKNKRLGKACATVILGVPFVATLIYVAMRYGP